MKLKPYPKYKDSGIQWIGEIPEGWEVRRIKNIFYEINKQSTTGAGELLSVSDIYGIKKRSEIIGPGDHLTHAETLIGYKKCKKGDLVINIMLAWKGAIGVSAYDGIVSPAYCVYRIKNHNPKYFHYLFRVNLFTNQFKRYSSGIIDSRLRLYPEEFFRIETIDPPLPDQPAIAHFLDKKTAKIDALIEKDKELIALLKEKRTALINHAVTKGLDPNVKLKDSGIEWVGKIPEGWEVVPLKKYIESFVDYRGATPEKTDEGIFLVTSKNIKEGKIDYELSKEYVFEDQYEEVMHRGKSKIGDLLFTTEAPLGEVANVDYEKIALAQRIIKIRGKKQKLGNYYLKYYMMTQLFQSHLQSLATGSTALGLKASNWCFLRLIVPPLPEQNAIASYLEQATSKIDKTIQKIEDKTNLLEEYKKSLIHHTVTGKMDVRGVEA